MNDSKWFLIPIDDKEAAPGTSFIKIIKTIQQVVNFRYVTLFNIVGAGYKVMGQLDQCEEENKILEIDNLFEMLAKVTQLEWGNFYLFRNYPESWKSGDFKDYLSRMKQSETTVRSIDNESIYIYTPDINVVNYVKDKYEIEFVAHDFIENLSYPS